MPSISTSRVELERLLDLYPADVLSSRFAAIKKSTKNERVDAIIGSCSERRIVDFAHRELGCCKQDIYVFRHSLATPADVPQTPWEQRRVRPANMNGQASNWPTKFYLLSRTYSVVVEDLSASNLTRLTYDFLWPVELIYKQGYLIVKLTKLHKSIKSYVPSRYLYVKAEKSLTEARVLSGLKDAHIQSGGIQTRNLHRGLRSLWRNDFCDASRLRYQRPNSTEVTTMNANALFKNSYPNRYNTALRQDLFLCIFQITDSSHALFGTEFKVEPREGYVSFGTFTEDPGDTHDVVEKVIAHC